MRKSKGLIRRLIASASVIALAVAALPFLLKRSEMATPRVEERLFDFASAGDTRWMNDYDGLRRQLAMATTSAPGTAATSTPVVADADDRLPRDVDKTVTGTVPPKLPPAVNRDPKGDRLQPQPMPEALPETESTSAAPSDKTTAPPVDAANSEADTAAKAAQPETHARANPIGQNAILPPVADTGERAPWAVAAAVGGLAPAPWIRIRASTSSKIAVAEPQGPLAPLPNNAAVTTKRVAAIRATRGETGPALGYAETKPTSAAPFGAVFDGSR